MGRPASDATLLRTERAENKILRAENQRIAGESAHHRARAIKAEQECAEWKIRFDLLLKRTPESNLVTLDIKGPAGDFPIAPLHRVGK